jgi:predicted O-methyltransferase YrrM
MSDAELEWLQSHASQKKMVVEFGAWCGRSSIALASAITVLCVDTWQGSAEHASEIAVGLSPWKEWRKNTAEYRNVAPLRCDLSNEQDVSFLERLVSTSGGADMVFVDAAHDYDSVMRDIKTARRLLSAGGLLCGHDYSASWPGVVAAVNDSLETRFVHDSIWSSAE